MTASSISRSDATKRVAAVDAAGGNFTMAAAALGVTRPTLHSSLATIKRLYGLAPKPRVAPEKRPPKERGTPSPIDRRTVAMQDEIARLRAELRAAHRQALDDDAARAIIGAVASINPRPPSWLAEARAKRGGRTPEVPVMMFSDWHVGETVAGSETHHVNAYDPMIAKARARRLVESIITIARRHGPGVYPGAVVALVGDFISGGIHPELAKTDAEEAIPAVITVVELLIWALDELAKVFGQIYVPCVYGNHGRATHKPEFKREAYKNFDWLIYQWLAKHFAGRKDIVIDAPTTGEVHFAVYGQRYLLMHGHELGVKGGDGIIGVIGPIMRGEVKVGKQASAIQRAYDVLLLGHWHQELWLPRCIVANSLKGWDEYAMKALRAPPSEPSQPLWFVHPRRGVTSRWNIKVDAPPPAASAEWVSFEKRAA